MKKVAIVISLLLGAAFMQPAYAEDQQVLAIIDTAVDSTKIPNVIYEVCITLKTCPNGTSFQEGKNAAKVNDWKIKGIDHGHNVTQVAVKTNPNIKVIFIRITDENNYAKFSAMHTSGSSLSRAVDWVAKNSIQYGIDAVSISQSRSNFTAGTCPVDNLLSSGVANLNANDVPTFVATGNDGKKNQVGFPACVKGVIAVGALVPTVNKKPYLSSYYTAMAPYTNVGPELGIVARGDLDIKAYGGWDITVTGTSVATPIASSILVGKKTAQSWNDLILSFSKVLGYPYISN